VSDTLEAEGGVYASGGPELYRAQNAAFALDPRTVRRELIRLTDEQQRQQAIGYVSDAVQLMLANQPAASELAIDVYMEAQALSTETLQLSAQINANAPYLLQQIRAYGLETRKPFRSRAVMTRIEEEAAWTSRLMVLGTRNMDVAVLRHDALVDDALYEAASIARRSHMFSVAENDRVVWERGVEHLLRRRSWRAYRGEIRYFPVSFADSWANVWFTTWTRVEYTPQMREVALASLEEAAHVGGYINLVVVLWSKEVPNGARLARVVMRWKRYLDLDYLEDKVKIMDLSTFVDTDLAWLYVYLADTIAGVDEEELRYQVADLVRGTRYGRRVAEAVEQLLD
jgi:hypothetical protein